jgi:MFS family permease
MSNPLAPTLRHNIWKMQAIRLLFWTHFVSSVLVPFFQEWGGLSLTQILLLNAWFMLWNFLLEIPTGTVADFLGRKTSVALGCAVGVVGVLVYVSRPQIEVFLLAEILLAAAQTLLSGADEALVYDSLDELGERQRAKKILASLESFKLGGIVGGALLGSVIAKQWGVEKPLLFQVAPLGLAGVLALCLREPTVSTQSHRAKSYRHLLFSGVRYFWGHRILRILTLDMVLVTTFSWLIIWFYQPLLARAGIDLLYFGVVHSLMCGGQILVLSQVERWERWCGSPRRFLVLTATAVGLAYLALANTTWAPLVICGILGVASFGLCRPVLFAATLNQHIPSDKRATVLSTISMFRTLGTALINPLAGYLADRSLNTSLTALGIAVLLVAWTSRIEEQHLLETAIINSGFERR